MIVAGIIDNAGNFAMSMGAAYPPFQPALARRTYDENPDLISQAIDLVTQYYKGVISEQRFYALMRQSGYSEETALELFNGAKTLLSGFDYITLWRRGEMEEAELEQRLQSVGYDPEAQEHLKKVTLYYPTPQDLVRMAVREVYTPAIVNRFGLNEDFPEEFLDASKKAGLSEEFARQYWAAHWELPSSMQGFEMFRREVIDEDTLNLLLKSLDVMPFWRDKLTQLQYSVVTRVDIRRLYKLGIYNEDQVLKAYRHLGYKPEDAEALLEFTKVAYNPVDEQEQNVSGLVRNADGKLVPSRTMVMQAYERGIYNYTQTLAALEDIGYPLEAGRLLIEMADAKLKQEVIDIEADAVADLFRDGEIDEAQFRAALTALGVDSRYIEIVMAREIAQAKRRVKRPTKADLEAWLKKGVIDADIYIQKMKGLGYTENDISYYMQEIMIDMEK